MKKSTSNFHVLIAQARSQFADRVGVTKNTAHQLAPIKPKSNDNPSIKKLIGKHLKELKPTRLPRNDTGFEKEKTKIDRTTQRHRKSVISTFTKDKCGLCLTTSEKNLKVDRADITHLSLRRKEKIKSKTFLNTEAGDG